MSKRFSNSDGGSTGESNTSDNPVDSFFRERRGWRTEVSQEISGKPGFQQAITILRPSNRIGRQHAEQRLTEIVAGYRDEGSCDKRKLPTLRRRKKTLDGVASAAKSLRLHLHSLTVPDRIAMDLHETPNLKKALLALDAAGVDLETFLKDLENSSAKSAKDTFGKTNGRQKELARNNMAKQCLELYDKFRDKGRSPSATKNGYSEFLRLVHSLATDEEASLERAAKNAYTAFRKETAPPYIRVKDKT